MTRLQINLIAGYFKCQHATRLSQMSFGHDLFINYNYQLHEMQCSSRGIMGLTNTETQPVIHFHRSRRSFIFIKKKT
jgi:hypothetical protein